VTFGLLFGPHLYDLFALTHGLPLGPQPCNPFALVASPKLGLRHKGHCVEPKPKVQKQVLESLVETHVVEAQDKHLILTPNRWTNREGELDDLTIPKELCGGGSTRLGGPFGVGRVLLQQFGTFGNGGRPLSNGDGQVTNCAHNLGWATSK